MTENYNRGGWNKDVLGGKKIEKLTIGEGWGNDYSGLESRNVNLKTSTILAKKINLRCLAASRMCFCRLIQYSS